MSGFDAVILCGVEVVLYDPVKQEMLASLKHVAVECGEDVTFLEFTRRTGHSYRMVRKKFGTWADLREAGGLSRIARIHREARHQNDEIVQILQELAGTQGDQISLDEFARTTGISGSNIHRLFGGWLKLRELAGLPAVKKFVERRHSAESIESALREYVAQHRGVVRLRAFCLDAGLSESSLWYHCGSWTRLLRKLGIDRLERTIRSRVPGRRWSDDELLGEFDRVAGKLGKIPSYAEFNLEGGCSWNVLYRRFGKKAALERRYAEFLKRRDDQTGCEKRSASGKKREFSELKADR